MNAQQLIIGYLLPVTAAIVVLWIAYRLLFSNSNRLQLNRYFLLMAMLFSLALPHIGLLMGKSSPQVATLKENVLGAFLTNEITVTGGPMTLPEVVVEAGSRPHFSLWQIFAGIYIIGVAVMALIFLLKMVKLVVMIARSPKEKRDGYTAVFTGLQQGSFSFLRYAIFPDKSVSPDIVRHEQSHIAHGHSWDILFAELMKIMQWFNPFIYQYKKELQSLHEYEADRDVVATGIDKRDYMMLILQQCTNVDFRGISNNFSLVLTKKRIKMITKSEKAKGLWWRLLATVPVLAILVIANTKVAAQEQKAYDDKYVIGKEADVEIHTYMVNFPDIKEGEYLWGLNDTMVYNPDGSYTEVKRTIDDSDPNKPLTNVSFAVYDKDGNPNINGFTISTIVNNGMEIKQIKPAEGTWFFTGQETVSENKKRPVPLAIASSTKTEEDSVFNIVEKMPEFPGGTEAMMKFVAQNVKYPEEAKEKGISGRVFVSFVVEKDGSVSNVEVLRSIGGGCDEEAVRVVKSMPKWTPGMQKGKPVRVNYNMPFFFKLDDGEKKANTNSLVGTIWEGTGTGTKKGVTYTWHSIMQFNSENEGLFIEKLTSQKKNRKPVVEFENVAMDFEYTFDGKKTGAVTPKNSDGTYMDDLLPEGFVLSDDGNTIVFNFYTATEDTGIKFVTYKKR